MSIRQVNSPDRPPRLALVDGLRLAAALAVACFHYFGQNFPSIWGETPREFAYTVHRASMYGWLGVEMFFLISGFVICMSAWGRTPGEFAVSRLSRLFPAYWAVIVLLVTRLAVFPQKSDNLPEDLHPRTVLANLTMFPGPLDADLLAGVAWTLDLEARFYLLMAIVLKFGATYERLLGFCTVWLVAAYVTHSTQNRLLDQFVLSGYAGLFVAGIALYLMFRFGQNLMLWTLLGMAWAYQLSVLQIRVDWHMAAPGSTRTVSWSLCALLLTAFLGVLMLATIGPLRNLSWRWLVTAGALTYPFYLVHMSLGYPLAKGLTRHVPALGHWGNMAVVTTAMLLLSYGIWRWVERPMGRWMRRGLTRGLAAARGPKGAVTGEATAKARVAGEPVAKETVAEEASAGEPAAKGTVAGAALAKETVAGETAAGEPVPEETVRVPVSVPGPRTPSP
ncbi:acyltransferase family protein [Streptomyces sp. ST1015]|uniref:acyltransferase family protein n=1 Tax=unclassified Streptomyces TaxID=2593676 RepID=UPI000DD83985|nr:acyltransferase family protein [Streptomyces sp. ST1015]QZZ30391.1 acyltransferase family protein [Streptomyces sp. ST1015]